MLFPDLTIERRGNKMIQITKNEARLVRKLLPGVAIKRTVNKYYVEEHHSVLELLKKPIPGKKESAFC